MFFDEANPPVQKTITEIRKSAADLVSLASLRVDK
jgi:hypothetical protein